MSWWSDQDLLDALNRGVETFCVFISRDLVELNMPERNAVDRRKQQGRVPICKLEPRTLGNSSNPAAWLILTNDQIRWRRLELQIESVNLRSVLTSTTRTRWWWSTQQSERAHKFDRLRMSSRFLWIKRKYWIAVCCPRNVWLWLAENTHKSYQSFACWLLSEK